MASKRGEGKAHNDKGHNRTSARATSYATHSGLDAMEKLSKKLTADLRTHIRNLGMFPVLSPKWTKMAKSLNRVSEISAMEEMLPKEDENATLWECEEVALRYLIEDGKLNLCLRLLVEAKIFERQVIDNGVKIKSEDTSLLLKFEESVGVIMRNAWKHVEAVQTTDLNLLIQHCSFVLKYATQHSERLVGTEQGHCIKKQEGLVLHYLCDVLKRVEDGAVPEEGVMRAVKKHKTTRALVKHINMHHTQLAEDQLIAGCSSLALIFNSDDYSINKLKYVSKDLRPNVVAMNDCVQTLVKDDRDRKKLLRPLLDAIRLFGMSAGK